MQQHKHNSGLTHTRRPEELSLVYAGILSTFFFFLFDTSYFTDILELSWLPGGISNSAVSLLSSVGISGMCSHSGF